MKKLDLITVLIFLVLTVFSQNKAPVSIEQAKQKVFDSSLGLLQSFYPDVKSREDVTIEHFTQNAESDGWFYFYTDYGKDYNWPRDAAAVHFIFTTKKNAEGLVYKFRVQVRYVRSHCENSGSATRCFLDNNYTYAGIEIEEPEFVSGRPEKINDVQLLLKTLDEAWMNERKTEKDARNIGMLLFGDLIKINKLIAPIDKKVIYKSGALELWPVMVEGELGDYTDDNRNALQRITPVKIEFNIAVKKVNGKWVGAYTENGDGNVYKIEKDEEKDLLAEENGNKLYDCVFNLGPKAVLNKRVPKMLSVNSTVALRQFIKEFEAKLESISLDKKMNINTFTPLFVSENSNVLKQFEEFINSKVNLKTSVGCDKTDVDFEEGKETYQFISYFNFVKNDEGVFQNLITTIKKDKDGQWKISDFTLLKE